MENNMTKQVLCIRDYIENGKVIWAEGEYYELLETYEDKNIDDCMYQIKTNTGEGNIFGEDFRLHFMPVNNNVEITLDMLKQMSSLLEAIKIRCIAILKCKEKHDPDGVLCKIPYIGNDISDDTLCFEMDCISFQIHETWAYGGSDYHNYTIPFTEIISDDWHADFLNQVEQKKIQKKKEETEFKKLLEAQQKAKEFAEYERLKKKFESGEGN